MGGYGGLANGAKSSGVINAACAAKRDDIRLVNS